MTNQPSPSLLQQALEGSRQVPPRTLAILLMVAGAIGFAVSLVVFGEQVLCLLVSTLVVFTGLWFNMIARRRQANSVEPGRETRRRSAAPNLLPEDRSSIARQAPAPVSWSRFSREAAESERVNRPQTQRPHTQSPLRPAAAALSTQVSEVLRQQGAQVRVEAQREDRCILQVRSRSGMTFTGLVLAGQKQVDVSEVRALYGLMTGSGSSGAFIVSGGSYTPQAWDWAQLRSLTLLETGQVNEIRID